MSKRLGRIGVHAVAGVLVLAACGGANEPTNDDASGESTPTSITTSTTSPTTTEIPVTDSTLVPTSLANIIGLSDECEGLANVMLGVIQVFGGSIEGSDQLFAAGLDSLPDELQGDIELLQKAVNEFAAGIAELGVNPFLDPAAFAQLTPEQLAEFEELAEIFNDAEIDAAFDSIEEYGARECDSFGAGG